MSLHFDDNTLYALYLLGVLGERSANPDPFIALPGIYKTKVEELIDNGFSLEFGDLVEAIERANQHTLLCFTPPIGNPQ